MIEILWGCYVWCYFLVFGMGMSYWNYFVYCVMLCNLVLWFLLVGWDYWLWGWMRYLLNCWCWISLFDGLEWRRLCLDDWMGYILGRRRLLLMSCCRFRCFCYGYLWSCWLCCCWWLNCYWKYIKIRVYWCDGCIWYRCLYND